MPRTRASCFPVILLRSPPPSGHFFCSFTSRVSTAGLLLFMKRTDHVHRLEVILLYAGPIPHQVFS